MWGGFHVKTAAHLEEDEVSRGKLQNKSTELLSKNFTNVRVHSHNTELQVNDMLMDFPLTATVITAQ